MSITLDLDLMSIALRFWYEDLNSFIFPFGHASITLRDIYIFIGLLVEGSEAVCLLDVHDPWHHILNFSSPYLLDFKYSSAFLNTVCRVLIYGGCYAFSPQLSFSSTIFLPYLPCLWVHQFGLTQIILSFPSLPLGQPTTTLVKQLTKSYHTPPCGLKTIMLSNVESFSTWWFLRFDDLISSCPSSSGT